MPRDFIGAFPFARHSPFKSPVDQYAEFRQSEGMARILLVEDEPPLARGVSALLRSAGHAVDVAEDGETAMMVVREEPYARVVLDIGLPDISGLDVLNAIRRGESKVPVLVLTARDAIEDRIAGLDHGADDYLLQPRSDEHTSELQSLMRSSYAVFCLKNKYNIPC